MYFIIHKIFSHIKDHFMYIHNFSLNQSKEDYVFISFLDIESIINMFFFSPLHI